MLRWPKASLLLATLVILGGTAPGARADLIFYNTEAEYLADSTGVTRITFEGLAPPFGFEFFPTPPGITRQGVNFTIDHTTSDGQLFVAGDHFYYPLAALTSQQSTTGPNNLVITLPSGFTSLALDFGSFADATFTFTLSTGETFTRPSADFPGLKFVGFASDVPVSSVRIQVPTNDVLNLTSFSFGAVVPEPGSLTLAGAGILSLLSYGGWRWRKARA